jgi:hypothetical protein
LKGQKLPSWRYGPPPLPVVTMAVSRRTRLGFEPDCSTGHLPETEEERI